MSAPLFRRAKYDLRLFRRPECGARMTCTKKRSHRTIPGHVKTMWCYRCKAVRDFIQIE